MKTFAFLQFFWGAASKLTSVCGFLSDAYHHDACLTFLLFFRPRPTDIARPLRNWVVFVVAEEELRRDLRWRTRSLSSFGRGRGDWERGSSSREVKSRALKEGVVDLIFEGDK